VSVSDFIRIVATAPYGVLPLQYDHFPECGPDATFSIAVPPEAAVVRRRQDSKSRCARGPFFLDAYRIYTHIHMQLRHTQE